MCKMTNETYLTHMNLADQIATESARLEVLVRDAVDILTPHFGVDRELQRECFVLPEVYTGDPSYYSGHNIITLPFGTPRFDSDVGHEVSHWFHRWLNGELLVSMAHFLEAAYFAEVVAEWGGMIYSMDENLNRVPITKKTTLPQLSCMSLDEALYHFPDITHEFGRLTLPSFEGNGECR